MNYKDVCITAPATPGLLTIYTNEKKKHLYVQQDESMQCRMFSPRPVAGYAKGRTELSLTMISLHKNVHLQTDNDRITRLTATFSSIFKPEPMIEKSNIFDCSECGVIFKN